MFRTEGSEPVKGSMLALTIDAILDFVGPRTGHFRLIECEISSHDAYGTPRESVHRLLRHHRANAARDSGRRLVAGDRCGVAQPDWRDREPRRPSCASLSQPSAVLHEIRALRSDDILIDRLLEAVGSRLHACRAAPDPASPALSSPAMPSGRRASCWPAPGLQPRVPAGLQALPQTGGAAAVEPAGAGVLVDWASATVASTTVESSQ